MDKLVGVIGAGSFGSTVASLLAENARVIMWSRNEQVVKQINTSHFHANTQLSENITATTDLKKLCGECKLIFPVLPSSVFREVMQSMSSFLHPYHILIHATKGLDTTYSEDDHVKITNDSVFTMSEVIMQETNVLRVGCMSGPNLAREILNKLPAACVVASEYDEVIQKGYEVLNSYRFTTFGSHDLKGAELAGAYKNIIALASGIVGGLELGKNTEALLITRGLGEMIQFGMAHGLSGEAFLGTAGIGDLVATCTSSNSRNYTFGYRFGKGENQNEIMRTSDEVVEGVRTLKIIYHLAKNAKIFLPVTHMLYKVIFEDLPLDRAIQWLMNVPYSNDVDFVIKK
jgi:glycerol-3-phosphate dehydrogenase (NAD(P)+)